MVAVAIAVVVVVVMVVGCSVLAARRTAGAGAKGTAAAAADPAAAGGVLPCLVARRSVFPRSYVDRAVSSATMQQLLDAAMWAPFHGSRPPWHFVVLGKSAMVEMQQLTLDFYDHNWQRLGWSNGKRGTEAEYQAWRAETEDEITGRWGPVSYMVGIVMRRQAGSKRLPEWEEAAATACAVQNMHIQASASPGVACYWSSWHDAVRDSREMHAFLGMDAADRCMGFFIVAACNPELKDSRTRTAETSLSVDWRG